MKSKVKLLGVTVLMGITLGGSLYTINEFSPSTVAYAEENLDDVEGDGGGAGYDALDNVRRQRQSEEQQQNNNNEDAEKDNKAVRSH